jgi:hypothetical protein
MYSNVDIKLSNGFGSRLDILRAIEKCFQNNDKICWEGICKVWRIAVKRNAKTLKEATDKNDSILD